MNNNCLGCHFLSKEYREENTGRVLSFTLKDKEREILKVDPIGFDRGGCSFKCYKGIWDEGISPISKDEDENLFSENRHDTCFYIKYQPSMLFKTAIELQKREKKDIQQKPGRKESANMKNIVMSSKDIWFEINNDFDITKMSFGKKINFVTDTFKKKIIFRDIEHAYVLSNLGFSKPAVILAGSVLEELLRLYLVKKDIKAGRQSFDSYIKVCEQEGLLKSGISRLTDSVRHFRNNVHLQKENTSRITISKATAKGAVASIFTIANDF
ncbi:MAG: hypothetical protein OCC45_10600 [Desulfotalea sp.]